jgi:hypothetical protein
MAAGVLPSTESSATAGLSPLLVDSGFAAFGEQIEDDIRADRLLAVDLEPAITACSCLGQLSGSPVPAAQRVTFEFVSGPRPAWT